MKRVMIFLFALSLSSLCLAQQKPISQQARDELSAPKRAAALAEAKELLKEKDRLAARIVEIDARLKALDEGAEPQSCPYCVTHQQAPSITTYPDYTCPCCGCGYTITSWFGNYSTQCLTPTICSGTVEPTTGRFMVGDGTSSMIIR
jgi:hypothetical protein